MVYAPHTLVAFGGSLGTSSTENEIWQCGVRCCVNSGSGGAGGPSSDPAAMLASIHAPLLAWWTTHNAAFTTQAKLGWVKVNNIGPDGKYTNATSNTFDYPEPTSGSGPSGIPFIINSATSWTTHLNRAGPGYTGRVYLPYGPSSRPDMLLTGSEQANYLAVGQDLLNVIQDTPGPDVMTPVVASKVNATNTPITGVRIGSVLDVQRRRKNAIQEVYVAGPWPAS